jgi:hypothetical protein
MRKGNENEKVIERLKQNHDGWTELESNDIKEMKKFYLKKKVTYSDLDGWLKTLVIFGGIMFMFWVFSLILIIAGIIAEFI